MNWSLVKGNNLVYSTAGKPPKNVVTVLESNSSLIIPAGSSVVLGGSWPALRIQVAPGGNGILPIASWQ